MFKLSTIALVAMLAWAPGAEANEYLTEDEAKALFKGKTFDGVYHGKKMKKFKAYEAPDGGHHVQRPNGKIDLGRKWSVNGSGQHCTTNKKWKKPRCSGVKDTGNGEYRKFNGDGKHTHTMTNFRDGNQLN